MRAAGLWSQQQAEAACHHLRTFMSKAALTSKKKAGEQQMLGLQVISPQQGMSAVHSSPRGTRPVTEAPQLKCSEIAQPFKAVQDQGLPAGRS